MELLNTLANEQQKKAPVTPESIDEAELKKQARLAESAFDITVIAGDEREVIIRGRKMSDDIYTMRRETPWLEKDDVSADGKTASFRLVSVEGIQGNQWSVNEGTYSLLEARIDGEYIGEVAMFGDIHAAVETSDGTVVTGEGLTGKDRFDSGEIKIINGRPVKESITEASQLRKMITSDSEAFQETEDLLRWMSSVYRKNTKD